MQYGARQLGCTKVQVHSYPDEPSHGARCSSAPVVTRRSVGQEEKDGAVRKDGQAERDARNLRTSHGRPMVSWGQGGATYI